MTCISMYEILPSSGWNGSWSDIGPIGEGEYKLPLVLPRPFLAALAVDGQ